MERKQSNPEKTRGRKREACMAAHQHTKAAVLSVFQIPKSEIRISFSANLRAAAHSQSHATQIILLKLFNNLLTAVRLKRKTDEMQVSKRYD